MLKKVEVKCKRCGKEFCRKRTAQDYCSAQCRKAAWSDTKKRRLMPSRRGILGSVQNGPFSPTKTSTCKPPHTPDLGAFVRAQIEAQKDQSNPITFTTPDGTKCRVWLASDSRGKKIIGVDRCWRVNVEELLKRERVQRPITPWRPTAKALNRPIIVVGRNEPIKNMDDALGVFMGFKVRFCIESEKELEVLGCGWRVVTVQLRGGNILLHHNGNVATMKRPAFKALIAANKLPASEASSAAIGGLESAASVDQLGGRMTISFSKRLSQARRSGSLTHSWTEDYPKGGGPH